MLEECSESILMRHNDDIFIVGYFPQDLILPKWDDPIKCILERLHRWQVMWGHVIILPVEAWVAVIIHLESWGTVRVT